MVFGTDINHIPPSRLPQDGYLPSEIYYSFYCLLSVTALCSIQHIIIILLIVKIKPKDIVFEKKNNNNNKNSSKPSLLLTQAMSVNESQPEIIP
jgi:predicted DNA-binding ArsR family transcriptional regulator